MIGVEISRITTQQQKSPLSGVGGEVSHDGMRRAYGFLTYFTPHSNFVPELYKRMVAFLYWPMLWFVRKTSEGSVSQNTSG